MYWYIINVNQIQFKWKIIYLQIVTFHKITAQIKFFSNFQICLEANLVLEIFCLRQAAILKKLHVKHYAPHLRKSLNLLNTTDSIF